MLSVSVVIPVYNQADLVGRTISAIAEGRLRPLEILVVDDGSDEPVNEAVARSASNLVPVRVITVPHGGPGRARQAGWQAAQGEVVAFTDADAIPEPEWLWHGVQAFDRDAIGAVEGQVVSSGVPTIFTHQVKNLSGGRFMTANMLYRRSVIQAVGGFKSRYREDSDLAFSVLEAGYEIVFVPQAVVLHPPREERWNFYFEKANRKRFEALLFRNHPKTAPQYLPRFQPTELLVVSGELLILLGILLGLWLVTAGLLLLLVGLPKRVAAWLDGRRYSGKEYLTVWLLSLALVPVEAYYHWMGVLAPPQNR